MQDDLNREKHVKLDPTRQRQMLLWILYNVVLLSGSVLALPLLTAMILSKPKWRRIFKNRWSGLGQKRAHPGSITSGRPIWIHALSVGEIMAAQALVSHLGRLYPDLTIAISTSTQSGFKVADQLFKGSHHALFFFPYDFPWCVEKVVNRINPLAVMVVETDIWPNFLFTLKRRRIPVFLGNIRLSDKTWTAYRRAGGIARLLFGLFEKIAVQTQRDAERFERLGLSPGRLCVVGNIKFDAPDSASALGGPVFRRQEVGLDNRFQIIVAGSTHEGEEAALLAATSSIAPQVDHFALVLAPRDPQRAGSVLDLAALRGFNAMLLSSLISGKTVADCQVIVVDSFGVLKQLYAIADIAFVGGSLVPCGGHNPLEPAAFKKPILFGPYMSDFFQIARWLVASGGALQVKDEQLLRDCLLGLLKNPDMALGMGSRAYQVFIENKGAVARMLDCFNLNGEPRPFPTN